MKDGIDRDGSASRAASTASEGDRAPETSTQPLHVIANGLSDHAPSAGGLPAAIGGISPARRAFNIRNLLCDEVVAGSDHDGDRETDVTISQPEYREQSASTVADPTVTASTTESVGRDGAVELLLAFTHSSSSPRPDVTKMVKKGKRAKGSGASAVASEASAGQQGEATENPPAATSVGIANGPPTGENGVAAGAKVTTLAETAADEPQMTEGRSMRRTRRPPIRFTADEDSTAPQKPPPKPSPQADAVVRETPPPQETSAGMEPPTGASSPSVSKTRPSREKRRLPTPSPTRTTTPKKPKTSARSKRAAVVNYVDVTGSDGQDSEISDVVLSAAVPAAPKSRVTKRKHMSQRQLDELLADDRGASPVGEMDAVSDVVIVARGSSNSSSSPGVRLHACEFCRQRHSAHPTYMCHACRRVYHDKCFVDLFQSEIQVDQPIEDQMERLSLHRPMGHSAMLRCASCQAAFIDFCKNRGAHWDCKCPTCTTAPHKIADYRRVSLKRIIDEHNLDIALKREKKATGGAGPKKDPAGKEPAKMSKSSLARAPARGAAAAVAEPKENAGEEAATTTMGGRNRGGRAGSRCGRGEEEAPMNGASAAVADATAPTVPASDAKGYGAKSDPKPKKGKAMSSARGRQRAGGRVTLKMVDTDESEDSSSQPSQGTHAMDVDQDDLSVMSPRVQLKVHKPIHTTTPQDGEMDEPDHEDAGRVTLETLEARVAIAIEDEETWSFKVACSPSGKSNESGMYKEATLYWHPKRDKTIKCSCCDKVNQTLKWFVDHTDPNLLSAPSPRPNNDQFINDVYAYLFVLERNGNMVPLQDVVRVIREKYSLITKERRVPTAAARKKTVSRLKSNGAAVEKQPEANDGRREALTVLRDVTFLLKPVNQPVIVQPNVPGPKKRGAVPPKFSCEVLCAENDKWLKSLKFDETRLQNFTKDCSEDVIKKGILDVCESAKNPKTCAILCICCQTIFNAPKFVQHTREPLLLEQQKEVDQERLIANSHDHHGHDDETSSWDGDHKSVNGESTRDENDHTDAGNGPRIRPFVCVAGVPSRKDFIALRLETVLGALEKLGNQADINKAIAAIVKSQEMSTQ